ncbi:hypothetical protein UT4_11140 [Ferrigenium sp. UT4]
MTPEAYSQLHKIKNGRTPEELLDATNKILELGVANHEVADAILKAINAGRYFPLETIAKIAGQSKSKELYGAVKDSLVSDKFSLLELHKQNYPDSKIEELLCDELYRVVADDSWAYSLVYRKSVVESLRDHGTLLALPVLEALLYELTPKLQVQKVLSDAIPKIEIDCEEEFVNLLRAAIHSIKNRDKQPLQFGTNDKVVEDVLEYLQKAKDQLCREELDEALGTARKAAEAISADIYTRQNIIEAPGKTLNLQQRIEAIKPYIPDLIYSHLKALQVFGNIGSHHRDENKPKPTDATVKAVLTQLEELLELFKNFRGINCSK